MMEFFAAALQALPDVAMSPLAMLAYTITICAYVFVAIRVTRHKNLLRALSSLPESDRLAALKDEIGNPHLKAGISPAQWIKNRIHTYYLIAFIVACFTTITIASLAVIRVRGHVDVDVTGPEHEGDAEEPIVTGYKYQSQNGVLVIRPWDDPFAAMTQGAGAGAVAKAASFGSLPLTILSVKVANNRSSRLVLSRAEIVVHASEIDRRPLLRLYSIRQNSNFSVSNVGWGSASIGSLRISIGNLNHSHSQAVDIPPEKLASFRNKNYIEVDIDDYVSPQIRRQSIDCKDHVTKVCIRTLDDNLSCMDAFDFAREQKIDEMRKEGMRIFDPFERKETDRREKLLAHLLANTECSSDGLKEQCDHVTHALSARSLQKVFGTPVGSDVRYYRKCAFNPISTEGSVTYTGEDGAAKEFRFQTELSLANDNRNPGGSILRGTENYDVVLEAGKSGYTQEIPLSQEIAQGKADKFYIRIRSDKSADFKFTLNIRAAGGDIVWSGTVDLMTFMTR